MHCCGGALASNDNKKDVSCPDGANVKSFILVEVWNSGIA